MFFWSHFFSEYCRFLLESEPQLRKQLTTFSFLLFSQKAPPMMFDWVLNTPLKQLENKMTCEIYKLLLVNHHKMDSLSQTLVTRMFRKIWLIFTVMI